MPRYTSPTKFSSALDACAARTAGVLPSTAQGRVVARGERRHRAALRPCAVLVRPSPAAVRSAAAAVRRSARLRADGSGPGRGGYRYSQYGRGTVEYGTGPRMRAGRVPGRGGTGSRGRRRACAPPPRLRATTAHTHTHTHERKHTGRRGTCARTGRAAREVELAVQIRALLRVPSMDSLRNGYCRGYRR